MKPTKTPVNHDEVISSYWNILNGQKVAEKFGVSREWVRQILKAHGLNGREIYHAFRDKKIVEEFERTHHRCHKCFKLYRISHRASALRKKNINLCCYHYHGLWEKSKGYKHVKAWQKKNKEKVREIVKRAMKKYRTTHPERVKMFQRLYYLRNKEYLNEYSRQRYIILNLQKYAS